MRGWPFSQKWHFIAAKVVQSQGKMGEGLRGQIWNWKTGLLLEVLYMIALTQLNAILGWCQFASKCLFLYCCQPTRLVTAQEENREKCLQCKAAFIRKRLAASSPYMEGVPFQHMYHWGIQDGEIQHQLSHIGAEKETIQCLWLVVAVLQARKTFLLSAWESLSIFLKRLQEAIYEQIVSIEKVTKC